MELDVDRNGHKKFRSHQEVKDALCAPRSGFTLDFLMTSEKTVAIAIDGFV
jgi:hypothetical protein